jgi:hypothetical protein
MMRRRSSAGPVLVGAVSLLVGMGACGGNSSNALPGADGGGSFNAGASSGSSGSGGSSGAGAGSGSAASGVGASATCIIGERGCLCDTTGACSPGLTCNPQAAPYPSICCSGSDCSLSGGSIGATCGAAGSGATCTPGITVLAGSGSNDGCGYPTSTFSESEVLCGINAVGGGAQPAVIQVFYSDEHALTLGCDTTADPVSALPADPGVVSYPQAGDPACVDAVGRPLRPVLYVTDITADPTCTAGDLQHKGQPYDPVAIFGTWKSATEASDHSGTPDQDPTANNWNLGSGADTVPSSCEQTMGPAGPGMPGGPGGPGMPGGPGGMAGGNYGTELRFEVGLVSGHSYRFQVVVHDGDQNKGGDSGEACAVFCAGTGTPCPEGPACGADGGSCPNQMFCAEDNCCYPGTPPSGTDAAAGFIP